MNFLDRTYCASPNCKNECGRQMSDEHKRLLDGGTGFIIPVSYAYFCDTPDDVYNYEEKVERK